jgi:hypothetical protein
VAAHPPERCTELESGSSWARLKALQLKKADSSSGLSHGCFASHGSNTVRPKPDFVINRQFTDVISFNLIL